MKVNQQDPLPKGWNTIGRRRQEERMSDPDFCDEPPQVERLSSYDEAHLVTYLRLLDAEADGAPWQEVVQIIFKIDPEVKPERAQHIYQSHLARAKWMVDQGYKHLLESRMQ